MRIEMTQKELAELTGYTYRRLFDINKGLPDGEKLFVKGEGTKYDLALFLQRWVQYNVERSQGADGDLETIKAQHERVKMEKSELELAKMKGLLIEAEAIKHLWADVAATVAQKLLYLPAKIAPCLVMIENVQRIEAVIDGAIREALTMIADTPVPRGCTGHGKEDVQADEGE